MAVTAGQVSTAITEAQAIGDSILKEIEVYAPGDAVPAGAAGLILDLASQLASKALAAWSAASGTPITAESVLALLPDQTPVAPPS